MPAARPITLLLLWLDGMMVQCHRLIERAFDPYRPERHYMRGPGPKWRARQRAGAAELAV